MDDDASVRDSLSLVLSLAGHPTATFVSAEDFLQAWQPEWRGCVVADIRLGGMSGLDLQEALHQRAPQVPVIVITAHGDVAAARKAFLNHAVDFIEKPFEAQQIVSSVEQACARLGGTGGSPQARRPGATLSQREAEVMKFLVEGLDNRTIAIRLGISHRTVEIHKARVLEKMGARNVLDLARAVDPSLRPA